LAESLSAIYDCRPNAGGPHAPWNRTRENHRSERYKLGKDLADRREFELVHELLERMIVQTPLARYANASFVVTAVNGLIDVLEAKGRPILIDFAHRCGFCGQGEYKFQNTPEDLQINEATGSSLGLRAPRPIHSLHSTATTSSW
jgi:hypothetical protein